MDICHEDETSHPGSSDAAASNARGASAGGSDSETEDELGGLPQVVSQTARTGSLRNFTVADFDRDFARFMARKRARREVEERIRAEELKYEEEARKMQIDREKMERKLQALRDQQAAAKRGERDSLYPSDAPRIPRPPPTPLDASCPSSTSSSVDCIREALQQSDMTIQEAVLCDPLTPQGLAMSTVPRPLADYILTVAALSRRDSIAAGAARCLLRTWVHAESGRRQPWALGFEGLRRAFASLGLDGGVMDRASLIAAHGVSSLFEAQATPAAPTTDDYGHRVEVPAGSLAAVLTVVKDCASDQRGTRLALTPNQLLALLYLVCATLASQRAQSVAATARATFDAVNSTASIVLGDSAPRLVCEVLFAGRLPQEVLGYEAKVGEPTDPTAAPRAPALVHSLPIGGLSEALSLLERGGGGGSGSGSGASHAAPRALLALVLLRARVLPALLVLVGLPPLPVARISDEMLDPIAPLEAKLVLRLVRNLTLHIRRKTVPSSSPASSPMHAAGAGAGAGTGASAEAPVPSPVSARSNSSAGTPREGAGAGGEASPRPATDAAALDVDDLVSHTTTVLLSACEPDFEDNALALFLAARARRPMTEADVETARRAVQGAMQRRRQRSASATAAAPAAEPEPAVPGADSDAAGSMSVDALADALLVGRQGVTTGHWFRVRRCTVQLLDLCSQDQRLARGGAGMGAGMGAGAGAGAGSPIADSRVAHLLEVVSPELLGALNEELKSNEALVPLEYRASSEEARRYDTILRLLRQRTVMMVAMLESRAPRQTTMVEMFSRTGSSAAVAGTGGSSGGMDVETEG